MTVKGEAVAMGRTVMDSRSMGFTLSGPVVTLQYRIMPVRPHLLRYPSSRLLLT
jgi:hypothetical protein